MSRSEVCEHTEVSFNGMPIGVTRGGQVTQATPSLRILASRPHVPSRRQVSMMAILAGQALLMRQPAEPPRLPSYTKRTVKPKPLCESLAMRRKELERRRRCASRDGLQ